MATYAELMKEGKTLLADAQERYSSLRESEELTEEAETEIKADISRAKEMLKDAAVYKDIEEGLKDIDTLNEHTSKSFSDVSQPQGPKMGWTEFLKAAYKAGHRSPVIQDVDPRLMWFSDSKDGQSGHPTKAMAEGTGASGGFLVPSEFYNQLQAVQGESALVRPRATKIRIRRRQVDIPVVDQTDTTAGTPAWFGGMQAYWAEEAAEKTATDASFRKVSLVAHKLIMYTRASDELLDDAAISLSDFLTGPMGFAGAITWYEDYSFLRGTGAGQPLGILNAGCTKTILRETANAVGYDDLMDMYMGMLPESVGSAVWMCNPLILKELATVVDPNGNYIWQPNARDNTPNTLFGRPVIFTEKLPTLGTTGDIVFADWRYYLIGDRQATTVESTTYDRWQYDQTSFRAVHRVDGQPWCSTEFTLADGTHTVSPFVVLSETVS